MAKFQEQILLKLVSCAGPTPAASSPHGRWWDEHTLEMTWQFVETAWVDHIVCRFYDNRISIDRRTNANYAPLVRPTLRGRREY